MAGPAGVHLCLPQIRDKGKKSRVLSWCRVFCLPLNQSEMIELPCIQRYLHITYHDPPRRFVPTVTPQNNQLPKGQ